MIEFLDRFVSCLSDKEVAYLSNLLWDRMQARRKESIKNGEFPPLNKEEMQLARSNKIGAIQLYRTRTGMGLADGKLLVETYLGMLPPT